MTRRVLIALTAAIVIYAGIFYTITRPWDEPDW